MRSPSRSILKTLRKLDYRLFWFINGKLHARFVDVPVRFINHIDTVSGDAGKIVIIILLFGVWARSAGGRDRTAFFLAVSAILGINALVGLILKRLIRERRPLFVFGGNVRVLCERRYRYSMPSGHTLIAFCIAAMLSASFPACAWVCYGVAALVGVYRVYVGSHFPSDSLAGALLGYWLTRFLMDIHPFASVFQ